MKNEKLIAETFKRHMSYKSGSKILKEEDYINRIKELLYSGDEANVELAFQVAEGVGFNMKEFLSSQHDYFKNLIERGVDDEKLIDLAKSFFISTHLDETALNEILENYLDSLLQDFQLSEREYAERDEDELEQIEDLTIYDFSDKAKFDSMLDIKKFLRMAGVEAVTEAINDRGLEQLGHDIYLTRNGHGAGFFDHSYNHEKELMDAAQKLGNVYIDYDDENSEIYIA